MGEDGDAYRVRIKASAIDTNGAVAEYADRYGTTVTFDTREAATDLAGLFSRTDGTAVVVQAAAPQDHDEVDAYLVSRPDRRTHDPTGSPKSGLTFDTTGPQYGALGEALVLGVGSNPPLLVYYARRDLDLDPEDPLHVAVDPDPSPITVTPDEGEGEGEGPLTWIPDCVVVARDGSRGRTLRAYRCEIKTGGGSLERDQLAAMRAVAGRAPVLKIQLDVTDLPDSYTARVRSIQPAGEHDPVSSIRRTVRTSLDEFE